MPDGIPLAEIKRRILALRPHIHLQEADGDLFFFAGSERKHPFATIVTRDNDFDQFSKLDHSGFYRMSTGVSRETFAGALPEIDMMTAEVDYTAANKIMPNPVYGKMYWLSVLSPDETTYQSFEAHLSESYDLQHRRTEKRDHGAEDH